MMNEPISIVLAVAAGGALGAFFFGGLWWTTLRGLTSPAPAAWFLMSLVVRTALTVLGFAAVSQAHWDRMLACVAGFVLARVAITRVIRLSGEPQAALTGGGGDAP